VLFKDDTFQWARLENLITLAADVPSGGNTSLDLSETVVDGAKVFLSDEYIRNALILALTQDDRLHVEEVRALLVLCPPVAPLCGDPSRASTHQGPLEAPSSAKR